MAVAPTELKRIIPHRADLCQLGIRDLDKFYLRTMSLTHSAGTVTAQVVPRIIPQMAVVPGDTHHSLFSYMVYFNRERLGHNLRHQLDMIFKACALFATSEATESWPASLDAISKNILLISDFGSLTTIGIPLSLHSRREEVIGISPKKGILKCSAARSAPPREKISCFLPQPSQIK